MLSRVYSIDEAPFAGWVFARDFNGGYYNGGSDFIVEEVCISVIVTTSIIEISQLFIAIIYYSSACQRVRG